MALGLDGTQAAAQHERATALILLAQAATTNQPAFDLVPEPVVDLAVSVGLTTAPDEDTDLLRALALTCHVLSRDGQFARLHQLSFRLRTVGARFEVERPFLAAFIAAFADVLHGRSDTARDRLAGALGLGSDPPLKAERTWEQVADVLVSAALREWLSNGTTGLMEAARDAALSRGDGLLLILADVVAAYVAAASDADLQTALTAAGVLAEAPLLEAFLHRTRRKTLFPAQLSAIQAGLLDEGSRLVALPTSSGKTFLAELRILKELARNPGRRAIYIAPYRLLARQIERQLSRDLAPMGFAIRDLGAAFDPSLEGASRAFASDVGREDEDVEVAISGQAEGELPDVAIMTPERLDAIVRLATSERAGSELARTLLSDTVLCVLDELQLIGRAGRGPRFDLLIARFRDLYPSVEFLGLSAAYQGADGLSEWLAGRPAITGGRRPTGTIEVVWETSGRLLQRYANSVGVVGDLDRGATAVGDAARIVLRLNSDFQPVLIVENTRPNAENVVSRIFHDSPDLSERWRSSLAPDDLRRIDVAVEEARALLGPGSRLAQFLRVGLAFHHAGVPSHLLRLVEGLVRQRLLRVVGATTTVAEGADLPFRTVVIPHLSFQGGRGRLERDLYQNLIGRAGRANVAAEGLVIVLDSDAPSLRGHVRKSLWRTTHYEPLQGSLASVSSTPMSFEGRAAYRDVESQLLAWLGEGGSDEGDQARRIAERTFSWSVTDDSRRGRIIRLFDDAFEQLELRDLVRAASPYRLTGQGRRARLTGLSGATCQRLSRMIETDQASWLNDLADTKTIDAPLARSIARLLFQSEEVLEQGLWLRRLPGDERVKLSVFLQLVNGQRVWPDGDELFEADVDLLAAWMVGATYSELAALAPRFTRGHFSGAAEEDRTADAAEWIGRIAYPAGWCWSGIRVLLGGDEERIPAWMRSGIEFGVPTESCAQLVLGTGISRSGAVTLGRLLPSTWVEARDRLSDLAYEDFRGAGLTEGDASRIAVSFGRGEIPF
jgi:hypothetical protein